MSKSIYDFPVELAPVEAKGIVIPRKAAVIRTDTNQPIGLVSNHYGLVPHKDVINSFHKAFGNTKFEEKIETSRNGAHMYATYRIPGVQVEVQKGDLVGLQFVAKNSYDGMKSFSLILGALRLVCTNGMVLGKDFFNYSQRHYNAGITIEKEFLTEQIEALVTSFKATVPIMQEMANTEVKGFPIALFNAKKITLPQYLAEEAQQEYARTKDHSLWGYYNSLTYAISHKMRKESAQMRIEYMKRAWKVAAKLTK